MMTTCGELTRRAGHERITGAEREDTVNERMPPGYCPYCAEEDLEPYGERSGWYCRSCARAFALSFIGIGVRS